MYNLKQLKEVEANSNKWRKTAKDLEFQLTGLSKTKEEIIEKIHQKNNDVKIMDIELVDIKTRLRGHAEEIEDAKNLLQKKRDASDVSCSYVAYLRIFG